MILWVVMLFFVVAVIWAIIGRTDIVATASGKIIPDDRIKVVQAAEAGTIQEIRVRDGDTVKRDDVLILLDTTVTDAEYAQAEEGWQKAVVEEMMAELFVFRLIVYSRFAAAIERCGKISGNERRYFS